MSSYPNLEYQNLYNALTMLLDVASNIQSGLHLFGKAFLQCLGCILPFLDRDLIDNLPYLTASSISVLPPSLHQDIINYLCYYILPFTISKYGSQCDDLLRSTMRVVMKIAQRRFSSTLQKYGTDFLPKLCCANFARPFQRKEVDMFLSATQQ